MHSDNDAFPTLFPDPPALAVGASASLTYEPFYGLHEKPFSLSSDPRFLYRSPAHGPAFDALLAGIRRREGLIVLTGEIGTGKTTLCRSVLQHLDRRTFSAFVPDPFVSREDLLKTLLVDFGVIAISDLTHGRFNGASRSELSYPLYEFLDSLVPLQAFAVLVIDETQNLSLPLLEEIRILSELERRDKLLQVVLVGQPELRSSLSLPQMRQVDQRISVRCELAALDAEGVAGYVNHRLLVAGRGKSGVEFTRAALEALHQGSAGVPRGINRLCDRALERAYVAQTREVASHFVWHAINDLGLAPGIHDRADQAREQPIVQAPERLPPIEPAPITVQVEASSPSLEEFTSEAELAMVRPTPAPVPRSHSPHRWAPLAASLVLAIVAAVGVPAWYRHLQTVNNEVGPMPQPPDPPHIVLAPVRPSVEPAEPDALRYGTGSPAAATGEDSLYTIVVASFTSATRAEQLVNELTTAGYRAHAVERDWGPPRGRLVQVNVGDYTSATDVERDLQQIRQLPGGYQDARIVARP